MMDHFLVRLVARNERTRQAWAHKHNTPYYVGPSFEGFEEREGISRESTPADGGSAEDTEPELRFDFDSRPRDIAQGWVFGSNRNVCDIYCGENNESKDYNIGRQTFSITINNQGNVVLRHLGDKNWTEVQYHTQKAGRRGEFVWIMFSDCKDIFVTTAHNLKFQVVVVNSNAQTALYKTLCAYFLAEVKESTPSIPLLSKDSGTTTADTSLVSTPKNSPFYYILKHRRLGKGAFGKVYVVVDASTGVEYAGKKFFGKFNSDEPRILASQPHVSRITFFRSLCDLLLVLGTRQMNDRVARNTVILMVSIAECSGVCHIIHR